LGDLYADAQKLKWWNELDHSFKSIYYGLAIADEKRFETKVLEYLDRPDCTLQKTDYIKQRQFSLLEPLSKKKWFPADYDLKMFKIDPSKLLGAEMGPASRPFNWPKDHPWKSQEVVCFFAQVYGMQYAQSLGIKEGDIPVYIFDGSFTCLGRDEMLRKLDGNSRNLYVLRSRIPGVVKPCSVNFLNGTFDLNEESQKSEGEQGDWSGIEKIDSQIVPYTHDKKGRQQEQSSPASLHEVPNQKESPATESSNRTTQSRHQEAKELLQGDESVRVKEETKLRWKYLLDHPLPQHNKGSETTDTDPSAFDDQVRHLLPPCLFSTLQQY
jgi:hypothetical protein